MSKNTIYLYLYKIPFEYLNTPLCINRKKYLERTCSNYERDESYLIWRLLEKAVRESYGIELNTLNPRRLKTGKWICDEICFSLSGNRGMLAVALSKDNIGVDVQRLKPFDFEGRGVLSVGECALAHEIHLFDTFGIWTCKEALYKFLDDGRPFETKIENQKLYDTTKYTDYLKTSKFDVMFDWGGDTFYVSVCCKDNTDIRVFTNVDLEKPLEFVTDLRDLKNI